MGIREFLQDWRDTFWNTCLKQAHESELCDADRSFSFSHATFYKAWNKMRPDGYDEERWRNRGELFGFQLHQAKYHAFVLERCRREIKHREELVVNWQMETIEKIHEYSTIEKEIDNGDSNV
jgi:hypothetical protein